MAAVFKVGKLNLRALPGVTIDLYHAGSPFIVDVNGDKHDDLFVMGVYYPYHGTSYHPKPGILLMGGPNGLTLATEAQFPLSTLLTVHPRHLGVGDFNEDGVPDLIFTNHGYDAQPYPGEQNMLYLSKPGGGYSHVTATHLPQIADFTHGVAIGDVNRDGHLDIFPANLFTNTVYLMLGDGTGKFTRVNALPWDKPDANPAIPMFVTAVLFHDFNGDGFPELLVGGQRPDLTARNFFWSSAGSYSMANAFTLPLPVDFGTTWSVHDFRVHDINYDGLEDLLVMYQGEVTYGGWYLQALINDGKGGFLDQSSTWLPSPSARSAVGTASNLQPWFTFLNPVDLNQDGRMDYFLPGEYQTNGGKPVLERPVFLMHRADGKFDFITSADLVANGVDPLMLGTMSFLQRSGGLPHELVSGPFNFNGQASTNVTEITFTAGTSRWVPGTASADSLRGTAGADVLAGYGGNDSLDGGLGLDVARFNGNRSGYTISASTSGFVVSGADGTDTLQGIERLQFGDQSVALDVTGNGGMAYRIYRAAFDRTPDAAGVGFWINALDQGTPLVEIAAAFVASAEFKSLYGAAPSNTQLLDRYYLNVLHRTPDPSGYAFWLSILEKGNATPAEVLAAFSESPENQAAVALIIGNGFGYMPYS